MIHLQVFGEQELVEHVLSGGSHYEYLISIGNPKRVLGRKNPGQVLPTALRTNSKHILRLEFFDVQRKDQLGPMRPRRIATRSDVKRAIGFYRQTRSTASGYTLHCWRGINRSPAFSLGLLFLITGSEMEAKKRLREIRPESMPLQLIVHHFDQQLGCKLSFLNEMIPRERIEEWTRELALEEDMLLEELPTVDDA